MLSIRTPIVAGNWKMYKTIGEAQELVRGSIDRLGDLPGVEVVFAPPFTALSAVHQILLLHEGHFKLAAQDLFLADEGAFTGLISPRMLVDAGCQYIIVGHSERRGRFGKFEDWMTPGVRALFGDNDETVGQKARVALEHRLTPIICIGETIAEREAGRTDEVIRSQLQAALAPLPSEQIGSVVIAYEPVWAIGTGHTCEAPEAERVCALIRQAIAEEISQELAAGIRIQYGGSVKPENAQELLGQPNIDGALVGGASLKADSFAAIVQAAV